MAGNPRRSTEPERITLVGEREAERRFDRTLRRFVEGNLAILDIPGDAVPVGGYPDPSLCAKEFRFALPVSEIGHMITRIQAAVGVVFPGMSFSLRHGCPFFCWTLDTYT